MTNIRVLPQRGDSMHRAYLALTADGSFYATENWLGTARTPDQWHERELTWTISPDLTRDEINSLLYDAESTAQRIHDGHTIEWNGRDWVGVFTSDDARAAYDDIWVWCASTLDAPEPVVVQHHDELRKWSHHDADGLTGEDLTEWAMSELDEAADGWWEGNYEVLPEAVEALVKWVIEQRDADERAERK